MFELIFGSIWTGISVLIAIFMYSGNGEITVNGVPVSHAEFEQMLWPKLFIGVFILIGVIFLIVGIRKLLKNAATSVKGEESYGIITRVACSNTYVNGQPIMDGFISVVVDDTVQEFKESLGLNYKKGGLGDCVRVKYYNGDVNIIETVLFEEIPYHMQDKLRSYHEQSGISSTAQHIDTHEPIGDYVVINGVQYKKQD